MIYVELQFDPDDAYLEHERELDNPLVIQALTRYKQNLAADFAEAFQNRGERLFICSQFIYELIQLGRNLEYRQVSFANLARGMTQNEFIEGLQCIQRSCVTLVDTALMASADIQNALPLRNAAVLFLELPREQMDQDAARVSREAREVYYFLAWKSCGSGITADVAFKYGLPFEESEEKMPSPETRAPEQKEVLEIRWPIAPLCPGRESYVYATPVQTLLNEMYSRSKLHQFLVQTARRIEGILKKTIALRLEKQYSIQDAKEGTSFEDVVREIAANKTETLVVLSNKTLHRDLFGEDAGPPAVFFKEQELENWSSTWDDLGRYASLVGDGQIQFAQQDDDAQFFSALKFTPLSNVGGMERQKEVETLQRGPLEALLEQNPLWNVVRYGKDEGVNNYYCDVQQYTLQAYASRLFLRKPGEEMKYDWKRSGVTTDVVIVPESYDEDIIGRIARAFQPTYKVIKTPSQPSSQ